MCCLVLFQTLQLKCYIKWSLMLIPLEAHLQMPFLFKTLLPSAALRLWFPDTFQAIWQCFCLNWFHSNILVILWDTVVDVWWKLRYYISCVPFGYCFFFSFNVIMQTNQSSLAWFGLFAVVPLQTTAHSEGSSSWIGAGIFQWQLPKLLSSLPRQTGITVWVMKT